MCLFVLCKAGVLINIPPSPLVQIQGVGCVVVISVCMPVW